MNSGNKFYIWQQSDWPHWRYDVQRLVSLLAQVHHAQGHWLGRMSDMGLALRDRATLQVLTEDVLKTSEIEGDRLNPDTVRSSIARRLGVDVGALAPGDRHVDGVPERTLKTFGCTTAAGEQVAHQLVPDWKPRLKAAMLRRNDHRVHWLVATYWLTRRRHAASSLRSVERVLCFSRIARQSELAM